MIKASGPLAVVGGATIALEFGLPLLDIPPYVLPRPSLVAIALIDGFAMFARATAWTLVEAGTGLLCAAVFASMYSLLVAYSSRAADAITPLMLVLQSTPLLAIAPILITWLGPGLGSKIASSFIVCFFPLALGMARGLRDIDAQELELYISLGATRWQVLRHLRWHRSLPWLFSSFRYAGPLSVVGAIVGEFVGSSRGLGFEILTASYYIRIDRMFAGVILSVLISLSMYGGVVLAERRFYFWRGRG